MQEQRCTMRSLDGRWRVAYGPVGEGTYEDFRALPHLPCAVPGAVHTAFIDAGLIPEPLVDRNDERCRWLEETEFWFSRTFALAAEEMRHRMLLTLHGLDTAADIWLNDAYLGHCSNAFIAHEFDVTPFVRPGENELVVRVDQGLQEVLDKPMWEMGSMWNNTQPRRAWMRKPQYVYGWDWTIWLPTCGIWRSVELTGYDEARMTGLYVHPAQEALAEGQPAQIALEIGAELLRSGEYRAEYVITDAEGAVVASGCAGIAAGESILSTTIPAARLWQPRGFGEAHCYQVAVRLMKDDVCCHALTRTLGLRTVSLREEKLSEAESAFTFIINGNPVFCKGANVVPADCLLGRVTAEQERELVQLAADSNMNMLRVWGGGVYASEAFLGACDRLGIMVWHDFMYACGYYPDHDADFYANVTHEAEEAIRRLRNHACVIGWSGNNEVQEMYLGQMQWKEPFPFYGERIYTQLLPRLVREMHPGAIYRESSPLGDAKDPAGSLTGDQHIWHFTHRPNDEHYLDLWRFTDFPVKFLSEFGVIGAMTRETTESCLSPEHRQPDDPVWLFHTNDGQEHGLLNKFMDVYFGDRDVPGSGWRTPSVSGHAADSSLGEGAMSLQQYILRSQCIQAEILRHIYDEFRARKFVCSGLLFWTLGDSMGIHNWSLIDYGMRRKPAYHAMKRAMAEVIPVIRGYEVQSFRGMAGYRDHWAGNPDPLTLWAVNDTLADKPVRMAWRVMTLRGVVLREGKAEAVIPANASVQVTEATLDGLTIQPEETILHVTLTTAEGTVTENRYFFAPYREVLAALRKSEAGMCMTAERVDAETVRVHLLSDDFHWQVHICEPNGVFAEDNDFDLMPGEERVITVKAPLIVGGERYVPEIHWVGED